MSLITTLARTQAIAAGRAQPIATVRHRWLSQRPLVFVPLTTAGEVGAPLGALVGTERSAPQLLIVPQPRDRSLRSAFLAQLAELVLDHIAGYEDLAESEPGSETDPSTGQRIAVERELCTDAPQLIVPNAAGIDYVRLLGRAARFRRTVEQDPALLTAAACAAGPPAPSRTALLGRWLTHYGERARTPGSALLVAMTDLLTRHWASGQSSLEDQHLGALLGWIEPPEGVTGAQAALDAQVRREPAGARTATGAAAAGDHRPATGLLVSPPAGPATDPVFDNMLLAPAVARFDAARAQDTDTSRAEREIRSLLAGQLRPTWDDVWRGIDVLRALPPAARTAERWKRDRWSFTGHRDRVRAGEPPQPKRDGAVTAAQKLIGREAAQAGLDAQEALDDPLVMAVRRLAGEAFAGAVAEVRMAWSEARVPRPRPFVTVATDDRPHLDEGTRVYRALPDGRTQEGRLAGSPAPGLLTVQLRNGMGRGKVPEPGTVPQPGERVCWTLFEHAPRGGPGLPPTEATPWTHGGPPPQPAAPDAPDAPTAEDFL